MSDPIRILSTRYLPEIKDSMKDLLIDQHAFIETHPVEDDELATELKALDRAHITGIFTSRHGIEAVRDKIVGSDWTFACMGGATRKLASDIFGEEKIAVAEHDSAALAASIINKKAELNPLVFFCSDRRLDRLPELLTGAGIAFRELVVYRTILTPHTVSVAYDAVLFFSPSAVQSYFSVNQPSEQTVMFAIGDTTAESIRTHCNHEVVVCPRHSPEQLLATVKMYYKK